MEIKKETLEQTLHCKKAFLVEVLEQLLFHVHYTYINLITPVI